MVHRRAALRPSPSVQHSPPANELADALKDRRRGQCVDAAPPRCEVRHYRPGELTFPERGSNTRDWQSYPILKMADVPEVKAVLLHRPETGNYRPGLGDR